MKFVKKFRSVHARDGVSLTWSVWPWSWSKDLASSSNVINDCIKHLFDTIFFSYRDYELWSFISIL